MTLSEILVTPLKKGDQIEMGVLFPGLSKEPLVWQYELKIVQPRMTVFKFRVFYEGTYIGNYDIQSSSNGETSIIRSAA
jgi:hypothetical protein